MPQKWINVLGNVSDGDGEVSTLVYSLNGGAPQPLSMGPTNVRLVSEGDFNVELLYADLPEGQNQLTISATDKDGNLTVSSIVINKVSGNVWPMPYTVDWNTVSDIKDVAQVVDGQWSLPGDGVRSSHPGYDRLVALGDMGWADYEVTVPITVHWVDDSQANAAAVGVLLRWMGHTDWGGSQPTIGWNPLGALGIYRWYTDAGGPRFLIYRRQRRESTMTQPDNP